MTSNSESNLDEIELFDQIDEVLSDKLISSGYLISFVLSLRDKLLNTKNTECQHKLSNAMCRSRLFTECCNYHSGGLRRIYATANCVLFVLDLARKFEWNKINQKWDIIINDIDLIRFKIYYVISYSGRCGREDKIMPFFKLNGSYDDSKLLYDMINYWIEMVGRDDGYFSRCRSVGIVTAILEFLFMIVDDKNISYLVGINTLIDNLYQEILSKREWHEIYWSIGWRSSASNLEDKFQANIEKYHLSRKPS